MKVVDMRRLSKGILVMMLSKRTMTLRSWSKIGLLSVIRRLDRELTAYEDDLGITHLITRIYFEEMSYETVMDQLKLLAEDVKSHP